MKISGENSHEKSTLDFVHEQLLQKRGAAQYRNIDLSEINVQDPRTTWLRFHWCLPLGREVKTVTKRDLKGAISEKVIDMLRATEGLKVVDRQKDTNEVFNFKALGGHVSGQLQALVKGISEKPTEWHVVQVYAVNHKEYEAYLNSGTLALWNPDRYQHVQSMMGISDVSQAYVIIYCRNDSRMRDEVIQHEPGHWDMSLQIAESFINIDEPPVSSYPNQDYFEIKRFHPEDYQRIYWGEALPQPNCRNCKNSTPRITEGDWHCSHWQASIPLDAQIRGCGHHLFNRNLVKGKPFREDETGVWYKRLDGTQFCNSHGHCKDIDAMIFDSKQLHALSSSEAYVKAGLGLDDEAKALIKQFDGELVSDDAQPFSYGTIKNE